MVATFKDMFGIPPGESAEGSSDENPIILPGCTVAEFESLMKALLTPTSIKPLTLSEDQWIGVLPALPRAPSPSPTES
ncbi:hypothetical protein DFP72DRAFT_926704 [Ephemerocybe angulata]|uniref:Uncharacterized protein n=1 Tax=Ephemerocybe angulata TaxID=980116 RepID=A0A8H6LVA1_9AGAR|nr:hypothetical protein DFP72DRAFT_926704 [Tulosesus angulatus]